MVAMGLWLIVALIFRRRFQFTIRSLLILTVAIATACSWVTVELKKARMQEAAVTEIRKMGGSVAYDWQFGMTGIYLGKAQEPGPAWLHDLLGADFFETIYLLGTRVTDFDAVEEFPDARILWLRGGPMPPRRLAGIGRFDKLLELEPC